jgi:putative FmdB family regulatory protein
MPIYEYACDKCGHEFEREQRMSDSPVKTCPKCKARKVTKLISRSSFVLKGGGWYADGYADAKKADTPSSDSEPKESAKSDDSSTSEKGSKDAKESGGDGKGDGKGKAKGKAKKPSKKSAA